MKRIIAVHLLSLMLAACSAIPQPTTPTIAVPTPTLMPTSTARPSETPEAQPASEWKGIPIMPGAVAGEGDEEGFVFVIQATSQQVREYYELELAKLGWQSLTQESGETSTMLMFTSPRSETLTITIISKGEESLVLLAQ